MRTKLSKSSKWTNTFDGYLVDLDCSNIIPKKNDVLYLIQTMGSAVRKPIPTGLDVCLIDVTI